MRGLNFTDVGDVLLLVNVGDKPQPVEAWQAVHDAIVARADRCKGLLIIPESDPPSAAGRALMKRALTQAPRIRVAFITNHPLAKVVVNTVVRWTFGERISHAPNVAAALLHMGVSAALEKSIVAEIANLRDLGLREAV